MQPFDAEIQHILDALPESIDQIVGYSLGGRLALGLIRAAPQRFRQATIISAHPGLTEPSARAQRRTADRRWIELLRGQGIAAFVEAWEKQPLFASQGRLLQREQADQRARRLAHDAEGLADSLEHLGLAEMPDTWDALTRFSGRLRWIVGGDDEKFLSLARAVVARRPETELHVLADVGHNLLLEAPDRLGELI